MSFIFGTRFILISSFQLLVHQYFLSVHFTGDCFVVFSLVWLSFFYLGIILCQQAIIALPRYVCKRESYCVAPTTLFNSVKITSQWSSQGETERQNVVKNGERLRKK